VVRHSRSRAVLGRQAGRRVRQSRCAGEMCALSPLPSSQPLAVVRCFRLHVFVRHGMGQHKADTRFDCTGNRTVGR